jgi:hypothetical protein
MAIATAMQTVEELGALRRQGLHGLLKTSRSEGLYQQRLHSLRKDSCSAGLYQGAAFSRAGKMYKI